MATRYWYSRTSTTYTLSKIVKENFPSSDIPYLNWYYEEPPHDDEYNVNGSLDTAWYYSGIKSVGSTISEVNKVGPNNNYYKTPASYLGYLLSGGNHIWIWPQGTQTIPAGSYIVLPSDSYHSGENMSSQLYYGGSYDYPILPATSLSYSTIKNQLSSIEIGSYEDWDVDWPPEYVSVYADINCLIFYAVTDVVVEGVCDQDNDTGNMTGWIYYKSGTLQFVKADMTSTDYTYYNVNSTGAYDWNYGGSYKGSYSLEPSQVSLVTVANADPVAGQSATIAITRAASTGSNASTYGFPITYKYQYSINGGSTWTDVASSTATTYKFTVPSNATSIMVRVIPSDSLGTGSAVASTNYTVQKPPSNYAGVSGTVKTVAPKVCVGSSIKTNVTVKKGVNGTVK